MEAKFLISPRILDHLGVAAYTSLQKCLAELCSNCYDADAGNIWIELPLEYNNDSKILIKDDGNGMSPSEISDKYLYIGYNRRDIDGDVSSKKKRLLIGNKGIGKLAGFGVAHTIELRSVKNNIESRLIMKKEIFNNFSTLTESPLNIESSRTNKPNGTELILSDLSNLLKPIEPNKLREHLFKVLPSSTDFTVKVNNVRCSAKDVPGKKIRVSERIDGLGTIKGFYVVADVRQKQPGVVIRVRNRVVTEPGLFGLEKRSHFSFSAEKIVGEINADFLDPFVNTSRDNFLAEVEEVQILQSHMHDFFKNVIDEIEKQAEHKRTRKIIEVSSFQRKLEKLPPHIRTKARLVIEGVIAKAKSATDEEINELVDWIIRYFESNVLRELMNSIIKADNSDIEKLTELINDWGVRQINGVTQMIKDQIGIIKKLEKFINSNKTLEIEVHKLVEGNLWLIREGLELWSSDKPLKTIFDKEFDKIYKKNESERPDVVCRSTNQGNTAVIIEFKRPNVKVKMDHITQALKYQGIVKAHRPSIEFDTYVIGRTYESDVLASKDKLEGAGLYLWSFSEVLQRSRARFEQILKILNA
jgi:hypothetical protein